MKMPPPTRRPDSGFTLVEVLISMSIVTLVMALALGTFIFGLRIMYKDTQRLATNATLRHFMAQVSKATLDASEFYIYPDYHTIDGTVASIADLTLATTDYYGIDLYHGDCLVLVTRTSLAENASIRQVSIYYRVITADSNGDGIVNTSDDGAIRYYRGPDYGTAGTADTLDTLLSGINLDANPERPGSILIARRALGRPKPDGTGNRHPIFSSKSPTLSASNESVAINAEVINGTTAGNMLSSSSFNYTISPRR